MAQLFQLSVKRVLFLGGSFYYGGIALIEEIRQLFRKSRKLTFVDSSEIEGHLLRNLTRYAEEMAFNLIIESNFFFTVVWTKLSYNDFSAIHQKLNQ